MSESDGLSVALKLVQEEAGRVRSQGLSTFTFFLGLGTCLLTAFLIGAYPASVWIVYASEGFVILCWRVYRESLKTKPRSVLMFLDFCWIANITMTMLTLCVLVNVLDDLLLGDIIRNGIIAEKFPEIGRLFCLFATGPLGWSVLALQNSLVLHDIENFSSCFIHLWPSLTTLAMRWNPQHVTEAYPGHFDSLIGFNDPAAGATMFELITLGAKGYLFWWVPFTIWMLVHGRYQSPERTGHDTVYLNLVRSNKAVQKRLAISNESVDSTLDSASCCKPTIQYMFIHAALVMLSFVFSALCYKYMMRHLAFAIVLVCVAMYNASKRYEWMLLERYAKVLKKHIPDQVQKDQEKKDE